MKNTDLHLSAQTENSKTKGRLCCQIFVDEEFTVLTALILYRFQLLKVTK